MAVNELFAQLHEVASAPKKQLDKYLAEGKKVVAVAPVYTPQEIIHSIAWFPWACGALTWKSMKQRNTILHLSALSCRLF